MFKHVVVGACESAGGDRAVRRALALVQASGGTLHVVSALAAREAPVPQMSEEFRYTDAGAGSADWVLSHARAQAAQAEVQITTHPVLAEPAAAIAQVAAELGADLIVVGCGQDHGDRHLSGVDRAVLDGAGCAVLVV